MSNSLLELVKEAKANEEKINNEKEKRKQIELKEFEDEWDREFNGVGRMTLRKASVEGGGKSKKSQKSISIFPDKSPQLQEKGIPTKLNAYTSKNVAIRNSKGKEFNAIINDRLAYRRAPRGQNVEDFSEIIYGPNVVQLSSVNYKKLKKGDEIYYDRGSAALRGPFIFKNITRGPELLMEVKDTAYDKTYLFSIPVLKLNSEKMYLITSKISKRKNKKTSKTKKNIRKKVKKSKKVKRKNNKRNKSKRNKSKRNKNKTRK